MNRPFGSPGQLHMKEPAHRQPAPSTFLGSRRSFRGGGLPRLPHGVLGRSQGGAARSDASDDEGAGKHKRAAEMEGQGGGPDVVLSAPSPRVETAGGSAHITSEQLVAEDINPLATIPHDQPRTNSTHAKTHATTQLSTRSPHSLGSTP